MLPDPTGLKIRYQESIFAIDRQELIFQAADQNGRTYCAVHEPAPTGHAYIIVPAAPENLAEFKTGKISLRTLLLIEPDQEWHIADGDRTDWKTAAMALIRQDDTIAEAWNRLELADCYVGDRNG